MLRNVLFVLSCFALFAMVKSSPIQSQGTSQQYRNSASYRTRTSNRVHGNTLIPNWIGSQKTKFWYRISTGAKTHKYRLVDCVAGERRDAFDHQRLAKEISAATNTVIKADSLNLESLLFEDDADVCNFRFKGDYWRFSMTTGELLQVESGQITQDTGSLPAAKKIQRSRSGGDEVALTIENRLKRTLDYFWVKSDGSLQRYGSVKSGDSINLRTFDGHAWLLKSGSGDPVAAFVATGDDSRAVVDDATPVPKSASQRQSASQRRSPVDRYTSPNQNWRVRFDNQTLEIKNTSSEKSQQFNWFDIVEEFKTQACNVGGIWWSPDSESFVMMPAILGDRREVAIVESSPRDSIDPVLHQFRYAKPGDRLDHPRPILFSLKDQWQPRLIDDSLFPNPYSINRVSWEEDGESFSFLYNERGHSCLRLITVDAESGEPRLCIDEQSQTFVCYSQKSFLHRLKSTDEWIWMSERSGWNHLYLIDAKTGEIKNAITSGDWVVRSVDQVDEEKRELLLTVSGINSGEDPYHRHLIRASLDGKRLVRLTGGDGDHRWRFSPDGRWIIDDYSRVDLPVVTVLRSAEDGELVCELEQANADDLLSEGWQFPERFVTVGRDGETEIHGIIVRPTDFEEGKQYPVLEHIYAGPHSSFVPKRFGLHSHLYEMAELGFIVVKIDGMGTSNRSKAFHDYCWKNLGDSGFPDRIRWIQAAARKHPEMDLKRVGIWGGSAGGQSAMRALIAHGDFYHAAVADCGCHDNRVDKIWWNEQWMGWPIGSHYEEQSNAAQAHRLQGDLMLIWGELDRNVDPASSMQVVSALIRADKDFTQLVVPGAGHGAASHPYAKRQQADFFVRKLWGREPRSQ